MNKFKLLTSRKAIYSIPKLNAIVGERHNTHLMGLVNLSSPKSTNPKRMKKEKILNKATKILADLILSKRYLYL
jgi:hypothetical protein